MDNPSRITRPRIPGYGLVPEDEGRLLPWSWATERLSDARRYWVATTRPDGMPHLMPVWGLWSEGSLYFSTGPDTLKARNLARDPRCTVSTENAGEAVVLEGLAERVRDKAEMSRVVPQYAAKYGMEPPDPEGNPLIAVRPTRGFGFIDDEEEFVRTATRWIF